MPEIFGHPAALAPFGLFIGFIGSLVGVGGGFLMVPYFTLLAGWPAPTAVGTSLGVIAFNASSGVVGFACQRRIDWGVGVVLGLASIPGTHAGKLLGELLSSGTFKIAFAAVGLLAAMLMAWSRSECPTERPGWFRRGVRRRFTDALGHSYDYSLNLWAAGLLSVAMGVVAGLFGVGGGFIHVPLLILLFGLPEHVAMASSHFVLVIAAAVGAGIYAWTGDVDGIGLVCAGAGAVVGAQAGVRAAARLKGQTLRRIFAGLLGVVAAIMLWQGMREST